MALLHLGSQHDPCHVWNTPVSPEAEMKAPEELCVFKEMHRELPQHLREEFQDLAVDLTSLSAL